MICQKVKLILTLQVNSWNQRNKVICDESTEQTSQPDSSAECGNEPIGVEKAYNAYIEIHSSPNGVNTSCPLVLPHRENEIKIMYH